MKILFVCSSNVCRSPYAEFVFRKTVEECPVLSGAGIEVASAAVLNVSRQIFPKAVVSLLKEGFDEATIRAHKPCFKWCDMRRFKDADVIIGMSKFHKLLTPVKYRKKFVTLSEAATGEYVPIPDPFLARTQESYDECMAVIKDYLLRYAEALAKRTAQNRQ